MPIITRIPRTSADDGHWIESSSTLINNFSNFSVGNDGAGAVNGFIRFPANDESEELPVGATITAAYLTMEAHSTMSAATCRLLIRAAAQAHVAPSSYADAEGRDRTSASVNWEPGAVTAGASYNSADFASVVQEIVDRASWAADNAILIYVEDNGSDSGAQRQWRSQSGGPAPVLTIEYEMPGSGTTHNLSGTIEGDSSWSGVLTVDTPTPLPPAPSGGPVDNLALSVTIDGRNASLELDPDRFAIQSVLGRAVDTAKLWLVNPAVEPELWQEVVIADATLLRLFGGYITHLSWRDGPDGGRIVEVTASDYGILLAKVQNVKREFEDASDAEMLGTLFQEYLADEFDVATYTYAMLNYERKRFNRVSLDAVLDDLAEAAGATWYVDAYKNLHFFANEEARAPYGLSDDPDWETTYPAESLVVDAEGAGVVNRVEVVGGSYLSEDATFYLPGTGEDARISLPFRLHAPTGQTAIQVWRNDGTQAVPVWTALTVKAGYLDEASGPNDVLYYYSEGVLEGQSNWPNLPNAVKATGRYDVPLRARLRNEASYELYGRWFDGVLVDEDIVDKATARLAGKGLLAKNAFGAMSISCDVRQPGLRSGMTIHLEDGLHGLDGDYLIQSCTATIGIGGAVVYGLELGAYDADLIDMIVRIARQARPKAAWREDEVLDDIFSELEQLPLEEEAAVATSQPPYLWGTALWGFSKWT